MPVRQREEHNVVVGEHGGVGRLEDPVGERQQVRMMFTEAVPALAAAVSAPMFRRPSGSAGCPSRSRRISPPA